MSKVLLVDDEEAILRMLAQVFERDGFAVVTVKSAVQGAAMLAQGAAFDVVITDLRMESPLAGFEVVRAANQAIPRPVIVILTAFPVPTADWRNAGADALWVKGMNTLGLPKELKKLIEKQVFPRRIA